MIRRILAAVALLAVAACGQLGDDPAKWLAFAPPDGWTSIPGFLGVHIYASPDADQFILLRSDSANVDIDREVLEGYDVSKPRMVVRRDVKICGSNPAHDIRAVVYFRKLSSDMIVHMISTTRSGNKLAAAYLFSLHSTPNPSAEASIHDLCPAKE